MKIGKKFNRLSKSAYLHYITEHKKYTDFNTLGLYRSLLENPKLTMADQIEIRDYAHQYFYKTFEFYQLKDPFTYINVTTLGQELTEGDERALWAKIYVYQARTLKEKKIKHRNFGIYAKHSCGYTTCQLNNLMIKQGSYFAEMEMWFKTDKNKMNSKEKSKRRKKERKNQANILRTALENL